MLTEDRHSIILETVNNNGSATLAELCTLLDTSESTIRRDLAYLDEKGMLVKVRGGAMSAQTTDSFTALERNVAEKALLFNDEKMAIAKYAASLIEDGDFVFLDAGTTTEKMIEFIPDKNVTFVTNAFVHAMKLASRGFKVFVPAGEIKVTTEAIVGADCIKSISEYNFTKSFIGVNGISLSVGLTTPEKAEAEVKRAVIVNTRKSYFLADHSKFDKITAVNIAPLSEGKIITDRVENKKYITEASVKEVMI
ncbi:MAG: DeoR/GlpR transcriptional regulator [Lachnospiraceae bacterium]|nr:DeoR/GlpR transcriptional regulator [Lachnospiraceae bacterium]